MKLVENFSIFFLKKIYFSHQQGRLEIILERCLPKADMENISIKCSSNEVIAIREAFFTSSMVDQCRFIANDDDNKTSMQKINSQQQQSCTDDLRLTLNSK